MKDRDQTEIKEKTDYEGRERKLFKDKALQTKKKNKMCF